MEVIIFGFFVLLALVFLGISVVNDGFLYRIISGALFLILGMMLVINGIDIQDGLDTTITTIDNVTSVQNETVTYATYQNEATGFLGLLMILLSIFLLMTLATRMKQAD